VNVIPDPTFVVPAAPRNASKRAEETAEEFVRVKLR
jgi:hypothetical protein